MHNFILYSTLKNLSITRCRSS